jgi:nucleoside-diphosphate-sugar epimerase
MKIPGAAYHELVAMYFDLPEDWPGCLWVEIEPGRAYGYAVLMVDQLALEYFLEHRMPIEALTPGNPYLRYHLDLRPGMKARDFINAVDAIQREEAEAMGKVSRGFAIDTHTGKIDLL